MHEGWQIARERPRARWKGARVYVSVNGRGEIVMNAAAYAILREAASVALYYYPAERCIGVKFPVGPDRNFFLVRDYGRGGRMRIVRGGRLLKQFGLQLKGTLAFVNPEVIDFRGVPMIVLRLDEGRVVRRRTSADEH